MSEQPDEQTTIDEAEQTPAEEAPKPKRKRATKKKEAVDEVAAQRQKVRRAAFVRRRRGR